MFAQRRLRSAWSESSLCAQWVAKGPMFLHAESEDSNQTGWMPRLIWVFAGRTLTLLVLSWCGSVVKSYSTVLFVKFVIVFFSLSYLRYIFWNWFDGLWVPYVSYMMEFQKFLVPYNINGYRLCHLLLSSRDFVRRHNSYKCHDRLISIKL